MSNFHLHLLGRVQGVGFRPQVWRLAREMGLKGWVNNAADGVHVELHCNEADARAFLQTLLCVCMYVRVYVPVCLYALLRISQTEDAYIMRARHYANKCLLLY